MIANLFRFLLSSVRLFHDCNEQGSYEFATQNATDSPGNPPEEISVAAAAAVEPADSSNVPNNDKSYDFQADQDLALAIALQEQLDNSKSLNSLDAKEQPEQENKEGNRSLSALTTEGAWEFMEKLIAAYNLLKGEHETADNDGTAQTLLSQISLVNADDILYFTEHLLRRRSEALGDTLVDIGYLIGYSESVPDEDYVQDPSDPSENRSRSRNLWTTGGAWGDGIYLFNNPFVNLSFEGNHNAPSVEEREIEGYKIMLAARLKSTILVAGKALIERISPYDTVIANKGTFDEVSVMGRPTQCVPLLMFHSSVLDSANDDSVGNSMIFGYHCLFQNIVDECFNAGKPKIVVPKCLPSNQPKRSHERRTIQSATIPKRVESDMSESPASSFNCLVYYSSPDSVDASGSVFHNFMEISLHSKLPTLIIKTKSEGRVDTTSSQRVRDIQHCSTWINYLSISPLKSGEGTMVPRVSLAYACGSTFEVSMSQGQDIETQQLALSAMLDNPSFLQRLQGRASQHEKKCQMCRGETEPADEMLTIGIMPTGSMRIDKRPDLTCNGFDPGAFLISYRFESGIQKNFNENPGTAYDATVEEAFVPFNKDGRDLLKRLVIAFASGMTFRVGTSVFSGRPNQVTWSSVSHKSSLSHGPFGYPDPEYFKIVNEDLDTLGIPPANQL